MAWRDGSDGDKSQARQPSTSAFCTVSKEWNYLLQIKGKAILPRRPDFNLQYNICCQVRYILLLSVACLYGSSKRDAELREGEVTCTNKKKI